MSEPTGPDRPTDAPTETRHAPKCSVCGTALSMFAIHYCGGARSLSNLPSDYPEAVRAAALAGTAPGDEGIRKAASYAIAVATGIWHAEPDEASEAVKLAAREIIDGLRAALAVGAPAIQYRDIDPATLADELAAKIPDMERTLATLRDAGKVSQADLRYEVGGAPAAPAPDTRTEEIMDESKGFHWTQGVYFKRLPDAAVRLEVGGQPFVIPAAEWESIVAAVSPKGANAESYNAAKALHEATGGSNS